MSLPIFDAHLDLAMNMLRGRDITRPATEQPAVENEIATVSLPDLRKGNVTHVCATIYCAPSVDGSPGYTDAQGAFEEAQRQIHLYRMLHAEKQITLHWRPPLIEADRPAPRAILLLEGADAIRKPDDARLFHEAGVNVVGLAWRATRYAGGTGTPGPLTSEGQWLVKELDRLKIIHDASHLAEQSFFDLMTAADAPVIASHSNCRAIVGVDPNERHLSDEMIKAIIERGGIIGINFYDKFLLPSTEYGRRRATMADLIAHIRHICDLAGCAKHVGIGTDMDGGLGREQIPQELTTIADLPKVGDALAAAGFPPEDVRAILFDNWAGFFGRHLS